MRTKILLPIIFAICGTNAKAQCVNTDLRSSAISVREAMFAAMPGSRDFYRKSPSYRKFIAYRVGQALSITSGEPIVPPTTLANAVQSLTEINESEWQNTTAVCVNRQDPNLIAVAAIDDACWNHSLGLPVYVSDDGGQSWNTQRLPRMIRWSTFGQPALASDAEGRFFCAYAVVSQSVCVKVARSLDGYNWRPVLLEGDTSNGYGNGDFDGDPNLTVDLSLQSPHYDRVYMSWSRYDTNAAKCGIMLSWSDDHGSTWTSPTKIYTAPDGPVQLQIGSHGEVCALYGAFERHHFFVAISTDGGQSFSQSSVGSYVEYPLVPQVTPFFTDTITALKGALPANTRASIALDARSMLHVVYTSWDSTHRCAELIARSSSDLGSTWKDSVLVGQNHSPYFDRFFPWLSHDAASGNTSLIYYSSEFDTANNNVTVVRNIWGENGWEGNIPLDSQQFNPLRCSANMVTSIGDYIGCDEDHSVFVAAWTIQGTGPYIIIPGETNGHSDILIYVSSPSVSASVPIRLHTDQLYISAPFPNPASAKTAVNFTIPSETRVSLALLDMQGNIIRSFIDEQFTDGSYVRSLDLNGISAGEYLIVLRSEGISVTTKLIVP